MNWSWLKWLIPIGLFITLILFIDSIDLDRNYHDQDTEQYKIQECRDLGGTSVLSRSFRFSECHLP